MAIRIPIDRAVSVTITREDRFPTTAGFNTALLLVPTALPGILDAANPTRLYANMSEVTLHWQSATEPYKVAQRFFQALVRPPHIKFAWYDPALPMADELDRIYAQDPDWFWGLHTNALNDTAAQRAIADWAETRDVIFALDTNDTDTESPLAIDDAESAVTITVAAPAVITWVGHDLFVGAPVRFTSSGTLPTGLSATASYVVASVAGDTFTVSLTAGGPAVATTAPGTGTHTATSPRYGGSIAEYIEIRGYDRSAAFYHTDSGSYLGAAAWAYTAGRDLDRANFRLAQAGRIDSGQAYTLKFKALPGVTPINKPSAVVQAVTGFVPGLGISEAQGHAANTYINIAGRNLLVEGSVGSRAFVDEIHTISWLKARMQESIFGVLSNNARIPYTNQGAAFLIEAGVNPPMRRAFAAGLIAPREDDNGLLVPAFEVSVDDVANIPVAQRRNRIAPDIKVRFTYANAIHFVSATMTLQF